VLYVTPSLVVEGAIQSEPATSEWWVVGALIVILIFFGSIGVWCWLVCGGRVQSCEADWANKLAIAHCYH